MPEAQYADTLSIYERPINGLSNPKHELSRQTSDVRSVARKGAPDRVFRTPARTYKSGKVLNNVLSNLLIFYSDWEKKGGWNHRFESTLGRPDHCNQRYVFHCREMSNLNQIVRIATATKENHEIVGAGFIQPQHIVVHRPRDRTRQTVIIGIDACNDT
jgi:hypothetical protein